MKIKINYKIRPAKAEDAREYVELKNLVWRHAYKNIFPEEVFVQQEAKSERKINGFADHFINQTDKICYVAEVNSKIVGIMAGKIKSSYPHFEEENYADLSMLYIHPDYQNIGIGTNFKEIFVKWAKSNGATKFVIGVFKDNMPARKAYESWGGKLSSHNFVRQELGQNYEEVFYTYDLEKELNL